MTKERYNEIRKDPLFLYKYFVENGGTAINPHEFNTMLPLWVQLAVGEHPQTGITKIVKFIDEKFAETK